MPQEIKLPRIIGSRGGADYIVEKQLTLPIRGETIDVDGRNCRSASREFVRALVDRVMVIEGAAKLILESCPPDMVKDAKEAAALRGCKVLVAGEVMFVTPGERVPCICSEDFINATGCICGSDQRDKFLTAQRQSALNT